MENTELITRMRMNTVTDWWNEQVNESRIEMLEKLIMPEYQMKIEYLSGKTHVLSCPSLDNLLAQYRQLDHKNILSALVYAGGKFLYTIV